MARLEDQNAQMPIPGGVGGEESVSRTTLLFDTVIGVCGVKWSAFGISEVMLPRRRGYDGQHLAVATGHPEAIGAAIGEIVALLDGEPRDLRAVILDERDLDSFRRRVYAATRQIACGATAGYGEIAASIGEPDMAREVGAALGQNPFPIVVPCHRVLSAAGALHGFSAPGGVATKRRMLEIEGAPGFTQRVLFA